MTRKTGFACNSSNKSFKLRFNLSFPSPVNTAISRRLTALKPTGSVRRTAPSSTRFCSVESFFGSSSHRTAICVSRSNRGSNPSLLFLAGDFPLANPFPRASYFPKIRCVQIHDVANDFHFPCPRISRRLPALRLRRAQNRHRTAPPRDGNRSATLLDLVQHGKAFGLELRRTYYPGLHRP